MLDQSKPTTKTLETSMQFPSVLRSSALAIATAFSLAAVAMPASATTILFVGNSFTYGDPAGGAPLVQNYRPGTVTDLNATGIGGVPALFKAFTAQAGLNYEVSLETSPGKGLDWHYNNRLSAIARPFDKVVLQSYSTLDASKPGDPATLIKYSGLLAKALAEKNPNVDIRLDATWSRADQTYKPGGAWYGQPIYQMALDVRAGYDKADLASDLISDVIPVGQAWNRAIATGLADDNPFNGIDPGKVNLWAPDSYHASVYGYYLEALTMFGNITGLDPRSLGSGEYVAHDLGIDPKIAASLQALAAAQLASEVPEPGTALMFGTIGGLMVWARKRKQPKR
jgi:hypothetical protein